MLKAKVGMREGVVHVGPRRRDLSGEAQRGSSLVSSESVEIIYLNDVYESCLLLLLLLRQISSTNYAMMCVSLHLIVNLSYALTRSVHIVFVTYIITMLLYLCTTCPTPFLLNRLIVLSVECRTGELGTLPDDFLDSVQEISFGRHFSS